jgi:hypothetical protein
MENCIDILKWALWRVSVRKGINYKQKWPINNFIILKTFATVLNTWCRKTNVTLKNYKHSSESNFNLMSGENPFPGDLFCAT